MNRTTSAQIRRGLTPAAQATSLFGISGNKISTAAANTSASRNSDSVNMSTENRCSLWRLASSAVTTTEPPAARIACLIASTPIR